MVAAPGGSTMRCVAVLPLELIWFFGTRSDVVPVVLPTLTQVFVPPVRGSTCTCTANSRTTCTWSACQMKRIALPLSVAVRPVGSAGLYTFVETSFVYFLSATAPMKYHSPARNSRFPQQLGCVIMSAPP